MLKNLKNNNLVKGLIICFVIGLITFILTKDWFHNTSTKVKCGNDTYAQYKNIEGGNYMYNINNQRMKSRSILDYYNDTVESKPKTLLYIKNNNSSSVTFIPESENLAQNDIDNLKICYPDSSMELQYNFRDKKIRDNIYEETKEIKKIQ